MKLSIITINYNNAEGLEKTIVSVVNQTCAGDFEYIVVDGASTDGSVAVIHKYSNRITKWVSEPDTGIYNAMNKGVKMASGQYCQFLNSGDLLHGNDSIARILDKLDIVPIFIGHTRFGFEGNAVSDLSHPLTLNRFYLGSIPHPSSFIDRNLLLRFPYDESLRIVSDWKFFLQTIIINDVDYRVLEDIVVDFDISGISANNRFLVESEREKVLKSILPKRVLLDYQQSVFGKNYRDDNYHRFYAKLSQTRFAFLIYLLDIIKMRLASLFFKSAKFSKDFSLNQL
jgi:glycosyltransferase involved in cell wall biosynthesis